MVESILTGKSEERRRIFEEAAGVTKYKLRRRSAFRKLEATEADLQRLADIISEVEKNVTSLNRQVKKAQRYQEFKDALREKEVRMATHAYSTLTAELEPLSSRLKEIQDQRAILTTQFDEREAEIEKARLELLNAERKLSGKQRELNELALRIQKREEVILVDRERRKALEDTKTRLARDEEETKERIRKIGEQAVKTKEDLQELFKKIQMSEADFQEENVALKTLESSVVEKNNKRKTVEIQRLKFLEGISNSKQEQERVKTQLENIRSRFSAIDRELEESQLLENVRQSKIEKLTEQKTDEESLLTKFHDQHSKLRDSLEALLGKKEETREGILNRRTELQTIKERIELLKKFIESHEDHPEGVQHLLTQGHLNGGCKGTLGEILTVESTYRQAIETALGEAAVSLIVEETDQALRCIEVLKADEKGAVTFFPMDRFSSGRPEKSDLDLDSLRNGSGGIIDWAWNLVNCKADFRPMVRSLLSDYLVVSDLEVATRYVKKLENRRLNLITLNGEIVSTWGPIKGGANGSAQAGIVGRKALVDELSAKFQGLNEQLRKDELESAKLEERYQETFKQEQKISVEVKTLESSLTKLEIELAQVNFEARKEKETWERLTKEQALQSKNQAELDNKIEALAPSLNNMDEDRTKFDTDFKQVSEALLSLEKDLNEQRDVVQDSRVQLVNLKGDERRLQEDIARKQESERELRQSLRRIDQELGSAHNEHGAVEKRIDENKKVIQGDFEQHKEKEVEVHTIEEEYFGEKERLDKREKSVREMRIAKDEVSENFHSLELRSSELRMEREKIVEKIKEEYQVKLQKQPIDEDLDTAEFSEEIERLKDRITAMEPVNLLALKEYDKEKSRYDFLTEQKNDLSEAESNLQETIEVINKTAREQFNATFAKIQSNFKEVFKGFFPNGQANLQLSPNADPLESEIIIEADPKGRHISALSLLSGGEKALTAISLLFSIYLVKPSPFCILDEVDAPLDDANIGRFTDAIAKFAKETQFIVITHNKLTMQSANSLYGITMEEEGVSKVVSVNFRDMDLDLGSAASKAA